jgi:hypothetical protein
MRSQLNKMKQEKQAWLNEAQDLRTRDTENKASDCIPALLGETGD